MCLLIIGIEAHREVLTLHVTNFVGYAMNKNFSKYSVISKFKPQSCLLSFEPRSSESTGTAVPRIKVQGQHF